VEFRSPWNFSIIIEDYASQSFKSTQKSELIEYMLKNSCGGLYFENRENKFNTVPIAYDANISNFALKLGEESFKCVTGLERYMLEREPLRKMPVWTELPENEKWTLPNIDPKLLKCQLSLLPQLATLSGCDLIQELHLEVGIIESHLNDFKHMNKFPNLKFLCIQFCSDKREVPSDKLDCLVDIVLSIPEIKLLKGFHEVITKQMPRNKRFYCSSLLNAVFARLEKSSQSAPLKRIFIANVRILPEYLNWTLFGECLQRKKIESMVFMLSLLHMDDVSMLVDKFDQNIFKIEQICVGTEGYPKIIHHKSYLPSNPWLTMEFYKIMGLEIKLRKCPFQFKWENPLKNKNHLYVFSLYTVSIIIVCIILRCIMDYVSV